MSITGLCRRGVGEYGIRCIPVNSRQARVLMGWSQQVEEVKEKGEDECQAEVSRWDHR